MTANDATTTDVFGATLTRSTFVKGAGALVVGLSALGAAGGAKAAMPGAGATTPDATLPVLGMAGSAFFEEASRLGLRCVAEAFADRAYQSDGRLVSRREPGAVLHDPTGIADRVAARGSSSRVCA